MAGFRGVSLPEGVTGSSFLHQTLLDAQRSFPDALGAVSIPADPKRFKTGFDEVLVHFEAARAGSPRRAEIARHVQRAVSSRVRFEDEAGWRSLQDAMSEPATPMGLTRHPTRGPGRLTPQVEARGEVRQGAALRAWLERMCADRMLSEDVVAALGRLLDGEQPLSLAGERFVLLGAGAELSPAATLLAAGAEVLWFDLRPPNDLLERDDLGGVLVVPNRPANLLEDPKSIAATIRAFAADGPVHLGMYAYAGGESQEWRLTAAMNAILRSLPPSVVKSVALLISPTTAIATLAADLDAARTRRQTAPRWRRLLRRAGVLADSHHVAGDVAVARSIVPLQGASYQAAQYVGKILAAEAHAVWGSQLSDPPVPLTVSANVAPITATRSLSHPVFEAGFLCAADWMLYISESCTTRQLQALLMIHDVTRPDAPAAAAQLYEDAAARGAAVFREQAHGGTCAQGFGLEGSIRVAAMIGFMRRPQLLLRLIRGR